MAERGRPPSERRTRSVRIYDDTAEMLSWVVDLEDKGETVAEFVESLIRREVENRYAPLSKRVDTIKAAYAGDSSPVLANDLGAEGG